MSNPAELSYARDILATDFGPIVAQTGYTLLAFQSAGGLSAGEIHTYIREVVCGKSVGGSGRGAEDSTEQVIYNYDVIVPGPEDVRNSLLLLIQHNVVRANPTMPDQTLGISGATGGGADGPKRPAERYWACLESVMARPRFAEFLKCAGGEQSFLQGSTAELEGGRLVLNKLFSHGRVQRSSLVHGVGDDKIAQRVLESLEREMW